MWYGSSAAKVFLSAVVAGVIAWGGAFMTASGGQAPITKIQGTLAFVTGVVAAAKDIQAYLTKPPQG